MYTCMYIYIYICVCVCVCVLRLLGEELKKRTFFHRHFWKKVKRFMLYKLHNSIRAIAKHGPQIRSRLHARAI
jgi:hypothetical protein